MKFNYLKEPEQASGVKTLLAGWSQSLGASLQQVCSQFDRRVLFLPLLTDHTSPEISFFFKLLAKFDTIDHQESQTKILDNLGIALYSSHLVCPILQMLAGSKSSQLIGNYLVPGCPFWLNLLKESQNYQSRSLFLKLVLKHFDQARLIRQIRQSALSEQAMLAGVLYGGRISRAVKQQLLTVGHKLCKLPGLAIQKLGFMRGLLCTRSDYQGNKLLMAVAQAVPSKSQLNKISLLTVLVKARHRIGDKSLLSGMLARVAKGAGPLVIDHLFELVLLEAKQQPSALDLLRQSLTDQLSKNVVLLTFSKLKNPQFYECLSEHVLQQKNQSRLRVYMKFASRPLRQYRKQLPALSKAGSQQELALVRKPSLKRDLSRFSLSSKQTKSRIQQQNSINTQKLELFKPVLRIRTSTGVLRQFSAQRQGQACDYALLQGSSHLEDFDQLSILEFQQECFSCLKQLYLQLKQIKEVKPLTQALRKLSPRSNSRDIAEVLRLSGPLPISLEFFIKALEELYFRLLSRTMKLVQPVGLYFYPLLSQSLRMPRPLRSRKEYKVVLCLSEQVRASLSQSFVTALELLNQVLHGLGAGVVEKRTFLK